MNDKSKIKELASHKFQKTLLNHKEDLSSPEKLRRVKAQRFISIFLLLTSLAVIAICYFLEQKHSSFVNESIGITHIVLAVFCLILIYWSFKMTRKLSKCREEWFFETYSHLANFLFLLTTLFIIVLCCFILLSWVWKEEFLLELVAKHGENAAKDYNKFVHDYFLALRIVIGFNILFLIYSFYTFYAVSINSQGFRFKIYIGGFLHVVLAFYVLYLCQISLEIKKEKLIEGLIAFECVKIVQGTVILSIFVVFFLYFINYKKSRNGYMALGSFLIILCFISGSAGTYLFRDIEEMTKAKNCEKVLPELRKSVLSKFHCTEKYVEVKNSPYLNCKKTQKVIIWENDINLKIEKKQNKLACINMKCCGVSNKYYRNWILDLASANLFLVFFQFFIASCCYYLSNKYTGERGISKIFEIIFIVLILFVIIAGYFFITPLHFVSPPQQRSCKKIIK